jgi:hypothetical protein
LSLPAALSPDQGVEPTSEPEQAPLEDAELKLAHSEAVEFETAPEKDSRAAESNDVVPS